MKILVIAKNLSVLPEMLSLVAKKKLNSDCLNNLFSQNNFVYAVSLWQLTDKYKIYAFAISLLLKQCFFGLLLITLI